MAVTDPTAAHRTPNTADATVRDRARVLLHRYQRGELDDRQWARVRELVHRVLGP